MAEQTTKLLAFVATDVGRKREGNEDASFADPERGLFIVADGMGGHSAGEVASQMAVDVIAQVLAPQIDELRTLASLDTLEARKAVFQRLEEAVRRADRVIVERARSDVLTKGMATTVDVLLLTPGNTFVAHLGDSRVYLLRKGDTCLLTIDHTLGQLLQTKGIPPDQAMRMPAHDRLVRGLGVPGGTEVDVLHLDLLPGDRFVLCTDGFAHYIENAAELTRLVSQAIETGDAGVMTDFANERGGRDNITVVVVAVEDAGARSKSVETTRKLALLSNLALFKDLAPQELLHVLRFTEEVRVPAGYELIHEGTAGDEMFVLLDGGVQVEAGGVLIARLDPGAHFGELSLVDDRPRSATVRTDAPSRLLLLRRGDFKELTRSGELGPKLLWNLIHQVTDQLRMTSWQLSEQVRSSS